MLRFLELRAWVLEREGQQLPGPQASHRDCGTTAGASVNLVTSGVRAIGRRAAGTRQTSAVMIVKDSGGRIILPSG